MKSEYCFTHRYDCILRKIHTPICIICVRQISFGDDWSNVFLAHGFGYALFLIQKGDIYDTL